MYWYEHRSKKQKQKMILKKTFWSWWIMLFSKKLLKIWENIEILNLWQQKKKELFSIRTKFS